ncbi:hypothetical protein [Bacillus thuringiensis]|uniref:hypothetical protein n=1 Tax=Bacillus thuringiensis TaxID=1428 RepID=UPI000CD8BEAE|nr:hypothetical protein [Bacillus thuringiensis]QFQ28998.1 hypothetical protein DDE73_30990 [Bacillus thuringiensis]
MLKNNIDMLQRRIIDFDNKVKFFLGDSLVDIKNRKRVSKAIFFGGSAPGMEHSNKFKKEQKVQDIQIPYIH